MSDKDELIRERQDEGDKLFYPAKILAMKRGKNWPKKHGSTRVYTDEIIEIHYDTYAPNLSVNSNGETVLSFHLGDISLYRPAAWVSHLKKLAKPLIAEIEKKKQEEKDKEEKKRLYRWGLEG